MREISTEKENGKEIAEPIVKKMRWPFPLVWIVPIAAAVAAGYYCYSYFQERGLQVTVTFNDASGLRPGETPVDVNGVQIGKISAIELAPDEKQATIHIELEKKNAPVATEGAKFWVVRPDFSAGDFSGLNTIVTGPYISVQPGNGKPQTQFTGLEKPPVLEVKGLHLILHASQLEHLQPDSSVYYRGIQVGTVQSLKLSDDSTGVDIGIVIQPRYAVLVRPNSQFWSVSGADIKGGVFTGVEVKLDSIRSLIIGGIAFATPESPEEPPAPEGMEFTLHDEAGKDWTNWAPHIPIQPDDESQPKSDLQQVQKSINSAGKAK